MNAGFPSVTNQTSKHELFFGMRSASSRPVLTGNESNHSLSRPSNARLS
jgi:hypothetical protein